VGLGNFNNVDVEDLTKHKMDSEKIYISDDASQKVNQAKDHRRNVCAVGTTVLRTLESSVSTTKRVKPYEGWTNKFIFPPYEVQIPNMMISNFHLPLSIPLMMVSAFGGYEQIFEAYNVAIKEKYRFGTYGDAMLIVDDD
jgi:S-adenosylmethionine:tRNA ribosyltransferase-isomerase